MQTWKRLNLVKTSVLQPSPLKVIKSNIMKRPQRLYYSRMENRCRWSTVSMGNMGGLRPYLNQDWDMRSLLRSWLTVMSHKIQSWKTWRIWCRGRVITITRYMRWPNQPWLVSILYSLRGRPVMGWWAVGVNLSRLLPQITTMSMSESLIIRLWSMALAKILADWQLASTVYSLWSRQNLGLAGCSAMLTALRGIFWAPTGTDQTWLRKSCKEIGQSLALPWGLISIHHQEPWRNTKMKISICHQKRTSLVIWVRLWTLSDGKIKGLSWKIRSSTTRKSRSRPWCAKLSKRGLSCRPKIRRISLQRNLLSSRCRRMPSFKMNSHQLAVKVIIICIK